MEKQKTYKWQDTNMALFGSDIEKKIKEASAGTEKAWNKVENFEGKKIWRIEQFKVVPWPRKKYGKFHTGDSYIVLHSYKKNPNTDALAWDVYFWIGSESSQDEYATAAYKTVELDHKLQDMAIQHREVQGNESKAFLSLFESSGVTYLEGGVESGFNHVEDLVTEPMLYQVKGVKGALVMQQVKCRKDKLNSGDVFILDKGEEIFQWNGKEASVHEMSKADNVISSIVSDRGGDVKKMTLTEGDGDDKVNDFWDAIPGERKFLGFTIRKYNVQGELEGGDDADVEAFRKSLYRLSDNSGEIKFKRSKRLSKGESGIKEKLLDTRDTFVLDDGFMVWVWIGKEASSKEKGLGMSYAMKYIKNNDRPAAMPITRVVEGREPPKFKEQFVDAPLGVWDYLLCRTQMCV